MSTIPPGPGREDPVPRRMGLRGGVVAVALLLCGGCTSWRLNDSLFLYVEIDPRLNGTEELHQNRRRALTLIDEFRQVNPGVNIHLRHLPSDVFLSSTAFRNSRGLGPDLMVTRVITALRLHEQDLSESVQLDPARLREIQPRFLDDFRTEEGLLAVPVLAQPEVACFNRRRVPVPPRTLDDLIDLSARGMRSGLPLRLLDLFWTSNGTSSENALVRVVEEPPTADGRLAISPEDRRALRRWFQWLDNANLQQNVEFSEDGVALVDRLEAGQLDWISCNSVWLEQLSTSLGPDLGVSELPGQRGRPAQGLTRLSVWSFGRHSTPRQRQIARDFVLFSLSKLTQRRLMLAAPGNLPVNREVRIPTKSSGTFAALAASLENARLPSFRNPDRIEARLSWIQTLLERMIVGGIDPEQAIRMLEAGPPRPDGTSGP